MSYSWSHFLLRVPVNASIPELYRAWATPGGLESWFLRQAAFTRNGVSVPEKEFLEKDDQYEWLWHGWPDDTQEKGTVITANGKNQFSFSFGKAGDVTIDIVNEEGENIVQLLQNNIPTDPASITYYHLGCMKGWLFYLTNLKSILEGGIDLRNRNVALKEVLNS